MANAIVNIDHVEYCTGRQEFLLGASCLSVIHKVQGGMDFIFMDSAAGTSQSEVICYNTTRGFLELQLTQMASCYTARAGIAAGESYSHYLADFFKLSVIINGVTLNPFVIDNDMEYVSIVTDGEGFLPRYRIQA